MSRNLSNKISGAILGIIINNQNFKLVMISNLQQRPDHSFNGAGLIVCG